MQRREENYFGDELRARKKCRLDSALSRKIRRDMLFQLQEESSNATPFELPMSQPSVITSLSRPTPLESSHVSHFYSDNDSRTQTDRVGSDISSRLHASSFIGSSSYTPGLASASLLQPQTWSFDPRLRHMQSSSLMASNHSNCPSSISGQDIMTAMMQRHMLYGSSLSQHVAAPIESQPWMCAMQQHPNVLILQQAQAGTNSLLSHSGLTAPGRSSVSNPSASSTLLVRSNNQVLFEGGVHGPFHAHFFGQRRGREILSQSRSVVTQNARELPLPADEEEIQQYSRRLCVPLATDEDQNWLSEFQCFVRFDLVEVFRASERDVRSRNGRNKVVYGQVGIRCRFCAHLPQSARISRHCSYPASLSRIYHCLMMMIRCHFGVCSVIPLGLKERYLNLKGNTRVQGATDSMQFWVYAAKKLGLVDSSPVIWINENPESQDSKNVTYGAAPTSTQYNTGSNQDNLRWSAVALVMPQDRGLISEFHYNLFAHVQLVRLQESERIGIRKTLHAGRPGIGCRHCCQNNRKGLCRLFPAKKRTLTNTVHALYEHVRRCNLCPLESRENLLILKEMDDRVDHIGTKVKEKEFYDRVWARMGHTNASGVIPESSV